MSRATKILSSLVESKELDKFKKKYPKIELSGNLENILSTGKFKVKEGGATIVIETPETDFIFSKSNFKFVRSEDK